MLTRAAVRIAALLALTVPWTIGVVVLARAALGWAWPHLASVDGVTVTVVTATVAGLLAWAGTPPRPPGRTRRPGDDAAGVRDLERARASLAHGWQPTRRAGKP